MTSSSASSFFHSSFAWNLQRFFTQIASSFLISSIFTSISVSSAQSSAWNARNLRRKFIQRLSVSSSYFSSSHDSFCNSSRYLSAWNSHWTLTWNVFIFSFKSSAWIFSCDFSTFSFSIFLSCDTSARISSSDSFYNLFHHSSAKNCCWTLTWNTFVFLSRSFTWTFFHDSFNDSFWSSFSCNLFIKSCLFVKNLYIMFHKLSKEKHILQSQRQHVFLELTHYFSVEISISLFIFISSLCFLKQFLQRSKMKLFF